MQHIQAPSARGVTALRIRTEISTPRLQLHKAKNHSFQMPTFISSERGWPMPPAAPSTATLRSGTPLAKPRAPAARTTSLVARASVCIVAVTGRGTQRAQSIVRKCLAVAVGDRHLPPMRQRPPPALCRLLRGALGADRIVERPCSGIRLPACQRGVYIPRGDRTQG